MVSASSDGSARVFDISMFKWRKLGRSRCLLCLCMAMACLWCMIDDGMSSWWYAIVLMGKSCICIAYDSTRSSWTKNVFGGYSFLLYLISLFSSVFFPLERRNLLWW
jgi:hypothetical protein